MPYIKQEDREDKWMKKVLKAFDVLLDSKQNIRPITAGELNFLFTSFIVKVLGDNPNYARFNEIIGMLECCKLELYRRAIVPYEEKKANTNGDVY